MALKIRKMKKSDAEEAAAVTRESMEDGFIKFEKGYYPKEAHEFDLSLHSKERYLENLDSGYNFLFVAEENSKMVGVALVRTMGTYHILGWICVLPSRQRKGIGEKLLKKVLAHSKNQGCHKISLNTFPCLKPAMNLYLKLGFVPEAYLRKQWWKVDFIQMSKWFE